MGVLVVSTLVLAGPGRFALLAPAAAAPGAEPLPRHIEGNALGAVIKTSSGNCPRNSFETILVLSCRVTELTGRLFLIHGAYDHPQPAATLAEFIAKYGEPGKRSSKTADCEPWSMPFGGDQHDCSIWEDDRVRLILDRQGPRIFQLALLDKRLYAQNETEKAGPPKAAREPSRPGRGDGEAPAAPLPRSLAGNKLGSKVRLKDRYGDAAREPAENGPCPSAGKSAESACRAWLKTGQLWAVALHFADGSYETMLAGLGRKYGGPKERLRNDLTCGDPWLHIPEKPFECAIWEDASVRMELIRQNSSRTPIMLGILDLGLQARVKAAEDAQLDRAVDETVDEADEEFRLGLSPERKKALKKAVGEAVSGEAPEK